MEQTITTELVPITKENALEVFTGEKLDDYLKAIQEDAQNFVADIRTANSRKQIASKAYSISKEKVRIDDVGKVLVAKWKENAKLVDKSRKKSRDFLDNLSKEIREPLTDWEKIEKKRVEAEELAKVIKLAYEEALSENDLFDRMKEVERKEAEQAAIEDERIEKERLEQEEKDHLEYEAKVEREAKEKAEQEKQDVIDNASKAVETAKRAKIEAQTRAKLTIQKAKRDKKEAEERAEREKAEAVEAAKQAEIDRQAEEKRVAEAKAEAEKKAAEKKAANVAHQRKVNRETLDCFVENGIKESLGKDIIKMIVEHKIKNIVMNY